MEIGYRIWDQYLQDNMNWNVLFPIKWTQTFDLHFPFQWMKCCRHQVKKDSLFSKRPIRVKQDAGINASEYIVPLSSEPMENMCSTAEERACREMCFDDKKCDDDDEDCKKVRLNSMGKGLTIFCGFGLRLMFLALVSSLDELLFRQIWTIDSFNLISSSSWSISSASSH